MVVLQLKYLTVARSHRRADCRNDGQYVVLGDGYRHDEDQQPTADPPEGRLGGRAFLEGRNNKHPSTRVTSGLNCFICLVTNKRHHHSGGLRPFLYQCTGNYHGLATYGLLEKVKRNEA